MPSATYAIHTMLMLPPILLFLFRRFLSALSYADYAAMLSAADCLLLLRYAYMSAAAAYATLPSLLFSRHTPPHYAMSYCFILLMMLFEPPLPRRFRQRHEMPPATYALIAAAALRLRHCYAAATSFRRRCQRLSCRAPRR